SKFLFNSSKLLSSNLLSLILFSFLLFFLILKSLVKIYPSALSKSKIRNIPIKEIIEKAISPTICPTNCFFYVIINACTNPIVSYILLLENENCSPIFTGNVLLLVKIKLSKRSPPIITKRIEYQYFLIFLYILFFKKVVGKYINNQTTIQ